MLADIGLDNDVYDLFVFFFFNDTATTEIYTLSLHDALPIWSGPAWAPMPPCSSDYDTQDGDRKSTRLNSSHDQISYAVFCLKKKKRTAARSKDKKKERLQSRTAHKTTTQ